MRLVTLLLNQHNQYPILQGGIRIIVKMVISYSMTSWMIQESVVELRSVSMDFGEQCVMMVGMLEMLQQCVDNWDFQVYS